VVPNVIPVRAIVEWIWKLVLLVGKEGAKTQERPSDVPRRPIY
jgi:hypothetical protein